MISSLRGSGGKWEAAERTRQVAERVDTDRDQQNMSRGDCEDEIVTTLAESHAIMNSNTLTDVPCSTRSLGAAVESIRP